MIRALIAALALCLGVVTLSAGAIEEEHQTDPTSDCLAVWDPFCPQGTPWEESGGGDDYPSGCKHCEATATGDKCSQVAEGMTGRTNCSHIYEGEDPVWCETSGQFCENITVTP